MHRSRLSVLAIFAAAAACSAHDDSGAKEMLSKDSTLVSTLEIRQKAVAPRQPLPDACGTVAVPAQPIVANKPLAEVLARRGYDVELLGNTKQARALFRRASELDGTDKSIAYHLGRTNEAVGDRVGALAAYCRYLTLAPGELESAEAQQRVATLSQSETRTAAVSIGNGVPTPRVSATEPRGVTSVRPTVEPRVAVRIPLERAARGATSEHGARSASAVASGPDSSPMQGDGATTPPNVDARVGRAADVGDVAATPSSEPAVEQPSPASGSQSRGPSRVQAAGMGAIAGAIIGAATGRSVKSAVIGAAAGGILGTAVGGATRPASRSMRPWASSAPRAGGRPLYRIAPAA